LAKLVDLVKLANWDIGPKSIFGPFATFYMTHMSKTYGYREKGYYQRGEGYSGSRRRPLKKIYITDEANILLKQYLILKYGTSYGKAEEVSQLIIDAIKRELGEAISEYYVKTYKPAEDAQAHHQTEQQHQDTHQHAEQGTQEVAEEPAEPPSEPKIPKEDFYGRWIVRFAGPIYDISDYDSLAEDAERHDFLLIPVTEDKSTAVAIDRHWLQRALELANSQQLKDKLTITRVDDMASSVLRDKLKPEDLTLVQRLAVLLYALSNAGSAIYSDGWKLIDESLLPKKQKTQQQAQQSQVQQPQQAQQDQQGQQAQQAQPKQRPKKKQSTQTEDPCRGIELPDADVALVYNISDPIRAKQCAEKKNKHLYMVLSQSGVLVSDDFLTWLMDRVSYFKFTPEEALQELERYLRDRPKAVLDEDKNMIAVAALYKNNLLTYDNQAKTWKKT